MTRRQKLADLGIALSLGVLYVVALVKSVKNLGYARDEGFYIQSAGSYGRWFEQLFSDRKAALSRAAVDGAWGSGHEHPALMKSLFALSRTYLEGRWHLFAMEGTSYRFPSMVMAGAGVALIYLWGAEARGRVAGLASAVLFAAMPAVFFHAHLACFDVPIITTWLFCAYCYWRTLRSGGFVWPMLTGIAFGLALDTKHNSWFLPLALGSHAIALQLWGLLRRTRLGAHLPDNRRERLRAAAALVGMALLGPPVFCALWPWLWHDTWHRVQAYVAFHMNHEYYNMEFLGKNYWAPPMPLGYAWVMTLATVPVVTLALFGSGVFLAARGLVGRVRGGLRGAPAPARAGDGAGTELLWLAGLLVNYAAWLLPRTPIFGGTKHWMTAYPFLALFAGAGFAAATRVARVELFRLRRRLPAARRLLAHAWAVTAILGVAVVIAPIVETVHAHPWGLASYTPLVGGQAGAATLGLNRSFWGYTTGAVADDLNREAPRGASVYVHDTLPTSWDMLQRDGRLRKDLHAAWGIAGADFGLYHHEKHMLGQEYQNWIAFGTDQPALMGGLDGVPVIWVYELPRLRKAHGAPAP